MFRLILFLVLIVQPLIIGAHNNNKKDENLTENAKSKCHALVGHASFYGECSKFIKTANEEDFSNEKYTAAHKTLPFGTRVRVTNTKNGKSVIVRINDRGPFIQNRIIDLTLVAAKEIDMIREGVVPVELEIIYIPEKKKI